MTKVYVDRYHIELLVNNKDGLSDEGYHSLIRIISVFVLLSSGFKCKKGSKRFLARLKAASRLKWSRNPISKAQA